MAISFEINSNLFPLLGGDAFYRCVNCGKLIGYKAKDGTVHPYCWYCPNCGTKVNWE